MLRGNRGIALAAPSARGQRTEEEAYAGPDYRSGPGRYLDQRRVCLTDLGKFTASGTDATDWETLVTFTDMNLQAYFHRSAPYMLRNNQNMSCEYHGGATGRLAAEP